MSAEEAMKVAFLPISKIIPGMESPGCSHKKSGNSDGKKASDKKQKGKRSSSDAEMEEGTPNSCNRKDLV